MSFQGAFGSLQHISSLAALCLFLELSGDFAAPPCGAPLVTWFNILSKTQMYFYVHPGGVGQVMSKFVRLE